MMHNIEKGKKYLLGIFSWFGFVLPLPERLKLIKEAKFDATTIWWEDEVGTEKIKKEDMPKIVRDSGLVLENIHVPYEGCNNIWSDSYSSRKEALFKHLDWLSDCYKHNIPVMVMHITDGENLPLPNKYGIESINKMVRRAEEVGVILAVENINRVDYIDFVFNEIQSPNLGFCYDSSHDWMYSKNKVEILKKWDHLLVSTHLSDNDGIKDRHWLPGEGNIDWKKVCDNFPKVSYTGFMTLETVSRSHEEKPSEFLKNAYKSLNWIRSLI